MKTLNPKSFLENLDLDFGSLKSVAMLKVAFKYVLKSFENSCCPCCYGRENNTMLERSKLGTTKEDMAKIKTLLGNNDVIQSRAISI